MNFRQGPSERDRDMTYVVDEIGCDEVPLRDNVGLDIVGKIIDCRRSPSVVHPSPSITLLGAQDGDTHSCGRAERVQ